ncbi:hexose carrier protein [Hortaea werneckii]|nr:hexose carrier protein [Hortaea werneckii]
MMTDEKLTGQHDDVVEHLELEPPTDQGPDHLVDNVSYGPGGLRGLIHSPYVFGAAFLASLGGFSFGYDQGVISIINVMGSFHARFPQAATPFGKGFMTGMLELGAFLGCFFYPYLADRISRRRALICVVVIFNIGAILQTAAVNYAMLVTGRTIGGIGVGTLALGAPIYISEIAPPNLRGSLLVLESVSVILGVVISFWVTYGTRYLSGEIAFRLPLGLQMVCATILGIGFNFYPYSPRWLALVDREDEALQSLCKLRSLPSSDSRVQAEFQGILTEIRFQKMMQEKRHPGAKAWRLELLQWFDIFSKKGWRRAVVGLGVLFLQQFQGINASIYYAPTLFESLGQSSEMALILSGVFSVLQLVGVSLCFVIIDHVGRRPLAIFGGFGNLFCYVIIAILAGLYSDSWASNPAAGWTCVAMAFLFITNFGATYAPLGWALPPEVFSTSTRSKGTALAVAVNWLSNFVVGIATPPMIAHLGYGTYVFFAFWCLVAGIWAVFLCPETKGKTLEEMDEVFGDISGREEAGVMQRAIAAVSARNTYPSAHANDA